MAPRRNRFIMNESVQPLQQIASDSFARWCWGQHVGKHWFHRGRFWMELVRKDRGTILRKFTKFAKTSPAIVKAAVRESIDYIINELFDFQFSELNDLLVIRWQAPKWRECDFTRSLWKSSAEIFDQEQFFKLFKKILIRVERTGLDLLSEDEINLYLHIWESIPNDWRMHVLANISFFDPIIEPENDTYDFWCNSDDENDTNFLFSKLHPKDHLLDFRFAMMLLKDYDSVYDYEKRNQIWSERWPELMYNSYPGGLLGFAKWCSVNDEQVARFKREWFLNRQETDKYCFSLIQKKRFAELNQFFSICGANSKESFEFVERIISKFFSSSPIPHTFKFLPEMSRSGGWIGKVIGQQNYQSQLQLRMDDETVKRYCYSLIQHEEYDQIGQFLKFHLRGEGVVEFQQKLLRSCFIQDQCFNLENFIEKLSGFDKYVSLIFGTSDEASRFKKEVFSLPSTAKLIQKYLPSDEFFLIEDLVEVCFSNNQLEMAEWKDSFFTNLIDDMDRKGELVFKLKSWKEIFNWCLNSDQKVAKFKSTWSMDRIFHIFIQFCTNKRQNFASLRAIFNRVLKWYYSSVENGVNFKIQKLREYENGNDVCLLFVGSKKSVFEKCRDEGERRAFLLRDLSASR